MSIGLSISSSHLDLLSTYSSALASGFSFISTPLFHAQMDKHVVDKHVVDKHVVDKHVVDKHVVDKPTSKTLSRMRSDFHIPHSHFASSVVGVCSQSSDTEEELEEELEWAAHLGLSAVLLPKIASYLGPADSMRKEMLSTSRLAATLSSQYSTRIASTLQRMGDDAPTVWMPCMFSWDENENESNNLQPQLTSWDLWNATRILLDQHPLVHVALELPLHFSPLLFKDTLKKWLGEPIRCLIVSTSVFVQNKSGYPVLPRLHQQCVLEMHRARIHILLKLDDENEISSSSTSSSSSSSSSTYSSSIRQHSRDVYCTYLKHLLTSTSKEKRIEQQKEGEESIIQGESVVHVSNMFTMDDANDEREYDLKKQSIRLEIDREAFEAPWHDFLQVPLQPLASNLSSSVYEVFEKDPVKYKAYENAVLVAFSNLVTKYKEEGSMPECILVAVVGAGRGPLVSSVLNAADQLGISRQGIHIFAIEKNRNAVITLRTILNQHEQAFAAKEKTMTPMKLEQISSQNHNTTSSWAGRVTVIFDDIRHLVSTPVKLRPNPFNLLSERPLHLVVSELLGSFGDNELSPECLDFAQCLLMPQIGLMIPSRSTSFLSPISSQRLWSEVRKTQAIAGAAGSGVSGGLFASSKWYETPLVVSMANVNLLANPQPVFIFDHPSAFSDEKLLASLLDGNNNHNTRETTIRFPPLSSSVLVHGFAGYFTADLTSDIKLSIHPNPDIRTKGMFSWFPIYFPLRDPIQCLVDDVIEIKIWRKSSTTTASMGNFVGASTGKVWYEWAVISPTITHVHNTGGRSSVINF
jgi:type II protein arginine methyltransferase